MAVICEYTGKGDKLKMAVDMTHIESVHEMDNGGCQIVTSSDTYCVTAKYSEVLRDWRKATKEKKHGRRR